MAVSNPRLVGASVDGGRLRVHLERVPRGVADPVLRVVGRRTGDSVDVPLRPDGRRWRGEAAVDDLTVLGRQALDVAVASGADPAVEGRPVVAPTDLPAEVRTDDGFTWSRDEQGRVLVAAATDAEVIVRSGAFDEEHYRRQVPDLGDVDPVRHYLEHGVTQRIAPSPVFDPTFYLSTYPDVRAMDPFVHYCLYGWHELRDPSAEFSTWWYRTSHMDPNDECTNPLAHYLRTGRAAGLSTRPHPAPSTLQGPGHRLPTDRAPRRICLFAAYDQDGIVDEYVVRYVEELARFADVYYLADSDMDPAELAKLAHCTVAAWSERHGEYDFGSYARLVARVGWDTIASYDEMLLVNDSCYLLRPLDEVFARMDRRACDWWGMQATKGLSRTRRRPVNLFREPCDIDDVRSSMIDAYERDHPYDFHVGSYFLAYRTPVLQDPEFRRYVQSVTAQRNKLLVIQKYEIGLTRWLLQRGHRFDTFVPSLYPFHPVYSRWYFRLLDDGFPLLKRYLLVHNHYRVPELGRWKEWVAERVPGVDLGPVERHLARTVDAERLRENLTIGERPPLVDGDVPDRLLSAAEFAREDVRAPKHDDWVAFPALGPTGRLAGSVRAVFEQVKEDPRVHKVVLTQGDWAGPDGENVRVVPLASPRGQHALMRCGTVLVTEGVEADGLPPLSGRLHNLVHLGGALPPRRVTAPQDRDAAERAVAERAQYRALLAASSVSATLQAVAHHPLSYHQVWTTGIPRHDLIVMPEGRLPLDVRDQLTALRGLQGRRRLVVVVSDAQDGLLGPDGLSAQDVARLVEWARDSGVVLAVWGRAAAHLAPRLRARDLVAAGLHTLEAVYRVASVLVTDDLPRDVDYLLTGGTLVTAGEPAHRELYDQASFHSGSACCTGPELLAALADAIAGPGDPLAEHRRRLLLGTPDGRASARVAERVRNLAIVGGVGKPLGELVS